MVQDTKRLFDLMGVVWIEAPMEAEGAAAMICKRAGFQLSLAKIGIPFLWSACDDQKPNRSRYQKIW